jgi:hypothetical protein
MFVASGVGPYSGQLVHFKVYAPDKIEYAINRYAFETQRHFGILDARLAKQTKRHFRSPSRSAIARRRRRRKSSVIWLMRVDGGPKIATRSGRVSDPTVQTGGRRRPIGRRSVT